MTHKTEPTAPLSAQLCGFSADFTVEQAIEFSRDYLARFDALPSEQQDEMSPFTFRGHLIAVLKHLDQARAQTEAAQKRAAQLERWRNTDNGEMPMQKQHGPEGVSVHVLVRYPYGDLPSGWIYSIECLLPSKDGPYFSGACQYKEWRYIEYEEPTHAK